LTLDDLEGQYCSSNCIVCSMFFPARRFYCEKNCKTYVRYLRWLFTTVAIYPKLPGKMTTCDAYYTSVDYSFREQRFVNVACMELCHLWEIAFSAWLEVGRWASDVDGTVDFS